MIVLPTRRRLERRRDALYKYLYKIVTSESIHEVEDIMRKIHSINLKLRTYFIREGQNEATELFEEKEDFEVKFPIEAEDPVTISIEDLQGEIEI
jgi:uncharacterized membrane-anchored protein